MRKQILDNDAFFTKNFEKLVLKYPRQTVVICREKLFTGINAFKNAQEKFPEDTPMIVTVPPKEFFRHGFLL